MYYFESEIESISRIYVYNMPLYRVDAFHVQVVVRNMIFFFKYEKMGTMNGEKYPYITFLE